MGWTWEKAKGYLKKRGDKDSGAEVTVNPCVGSEEVGIFFSKGRQKFAAISIRRRKEKEGKCPVQFFE